MPAAPHPHLERLEGLHPLLLRTINKALDLSRVPFMIVEGVRTDEECFRNFGLGRTPAECHAGGCPEGWSRPSAKKVTWLAHALSSNHRKQRDGYGHAVDLLPEPYDWKVPGRFDALALAMFEAASQVGAHLRWGADWDGDRRLRERGETDNPHFELILPAAHAG